jgi:hypothetical protein
VLGLLDSAIQTALGFPILTAWRLVGERKVDTSTRYNTGLQMEGGAFSWTPVAIQLSNDSACEIRAKELQAATLIGINDLGSIFPGWIS